MIEFTETVGVRSEFNEKTKGVRRPSVAYPSKRNASRSKRAILDSALIEFSEFGHSGARVDSVAERAGVSKPLIYSYFGDKDALYAAALREAYIQIREGERELDLQDEDPEMAIRKLVDFTLRHFQRKPWFISMLNTENLRRGSTIREIKDVAEIQTQLINKVKWILAEGVEQGLFREGIDPVEVYLSIASLCYFPISNKYTLGAVFGISIDEQWLNRRSHDIGEMVIRYLRPFPEKAETESR